MASYIVAKYAIIKGSVQPLKIGNDKKISKQGLKYSVQRADHLAFKIDLSIKGKYN